MLRLLANLLLSLYQKNIRYFVIYEFPNTETVDITNPRYILTKIPADIRIFEIEFKTNYNYGITAVSRMHKDNQEIKIVNKIIIPHNLDFKKILY